MQLVPATKVYSIRKHILIPYNKVLLQYKMITQKMNKQLFNYPFISEQNSAILIIQVNFLSTSK